MKIEKLGKSTTVMNNPYGKANYFAWPSIARLQNGKIAVTASGYRYAHVCPFGKAVISYSEDEGKTYTAPAPVIGTPLDDRDSGVLAFGKSNVMVTSFNNTVQFQKEHLGHGLTPGYDQKKFNAFFEKYLETISPEEEQKYLGSLFRISNDCGVTFGEIKKSPISSPHGPCVLHDGTILWVGKVFSEDDTYNEKIVIKAYKIAPDGAMEFMGEIPSINVDKERLILCEPHAIELPDKKIICHIRAQRYTPTKCTYFTTYQSESLNGGKTWSKPHRILDLLGGAPAHLLLHSSGILISTYGYREKPYGIKVMFSKDNGETWDSGYDLYTNEIGPDLGYPCSIELKDGSILTVFYAHETKDSPATIMQQKWRFENED